MYRHRWAPRKIHPSASYCRTTTGDAGDGCSEPPVEEAAVVLEEPPQVTTTWVQEDRKIFSAEALFQFLKKFMTYDHIRKMQGGLTTNMNECGNGVIASDGDDKKNGAAACSIAIMCDSAFASIYSLSLIHI